MNVIQLLIEQARRRPQHVALVESAGARTRSITFGEIEEATARAAAYLWQQGLRPGDGVLLLQPMSIDLYLAIAAMFRLGLVVMFLDPSAGKDHIERCCALWPPRALISSTKAQLLRLWYPTLRRIPIQIVIGWPVPGAKRLSSYRRCARHSEQFDDDSAPALLTFTSGSTGEPRALVRSHKLLLAQHLELSKALELGSDEICLSALPIVLLSQLASGVTGIIPSADLRRPDSYAVPPIAAQIEHCRVTTVIGAPAFVERLTAHTLRERIPLTGLRKIIAGGGPVFPRLFDQALQAAPQADVRAVYGSTEAEPIACLRNNQLGERERAFTRQGKGLPIGTPAAGIDVRIIEDRVWQPIGRLTREEFAALTMPSEKTGEIVVSGEHVIQGYLNGLGDRETKIRVEDVVWHRTGDAGLFDDQGRLWLQGRCAARIRDQHGDSYPLTVEAAAAEQFGIARSAFISHAGVRQLVVESCSDSPTTYEQIKEQLLWAHLQRIVPLTKLPVDGRHNSKIDYPALLRLLSRDI